MADRCRTIILLLVVFYLFSEDFEFSHPALDTYFVNGTFEKIESNFFK